MMRFWRKLRTRGLADFADGIRPELTELPVPRAGDALLQRIMESRAGGTRVILPHGDGEGTRAPMRLVLTIAAAGLLLIGGSAVLNRNGASSDVVSTSWWFTSAAYAQAPTASIPPARFAVPERFRPLTVRYVRTEDGRTTGHTDISVQRDAVGAVPAWRIVTRRPAGSGTSVDSVYIAANDLRLLRVVATQAPYNSYAGIRVVQTIDGLHVTGTMDARRDGDAGAHRTFDRQLPREFAPYVADAVAPIYMMGAELTPSWRGRLAVLGWAVRNDNIATVVDMRVDGRETLRVPAGAFDCWRISIDVAGRRQWYWARVSDGLGIRSRAEENGVVRETSLEVDRVNR